MANNGFNGTTLTWGSTCHAPLRSVNRNFQGGKVDVTGSTSPEHTYVAGLQDSDVDFTVAGGNSIAVGASAALVITWFDGTTDTLGKYTCLGNSISGSVDGAIETTITCARLST